MRAPYNDLPALEKIARNNANVVAVMVEPVTGEGGINVPDANYLNGIRKICDANNWLLILDEIQTGMGRTGKMFAFQHTDISPDIMTLAKGLGNGVPIGACLASNIAADLFKPGHHGSTYGGNPLVCSAALAVLETLEQQQLVTRAKQLGDTMLTDFKKELDGVAGVVDIRGKGLMLAVELDKPCGILSKQALEQGLLINVTAERVVRLLPPLILSDEQAHQIVSQTSGLIKNFLLNQ